MKEKIIWLIVIVLDLIFLILNLVGLVWVYAVSVFLTENNVEFSGEISWMMFGIYLLILRYVLLKYMPSVWLKKWTGKVFVP